MKKLLNISVIAALAVLPMAANATAADVDKQPSGIDMEAQGAETTANNATATDAPKYELAASHTTDSNVATAGYVKGAYNAAIRAVNYVADQVDSINTDLSGKADTDLSNVDAGSVTTTLLDDGAVTTAKIADSNVTTAKIADSNVTTAKIADSNVTTAKIANDAVTNDKIADDAVDTAQIADGAVTADKLADDALDAYGFATQDGVEATIADAIGDTTATVDLSGLTLANAAVGGTATASIDVMDTWGATTVGTPVIGTVNLANTMTAVTLSGNDANTTVSISAPATIEYTEE